MGRKSAMGRLGVWMNGIAVGTCTPLRPAKHERGLTSGTAATAQSFVQE